MRTSYKQLALEYQDRFCAAVADYKRENELRLFYEKENKQLKGKLKTVTDAADSTMCHMQYYEKQCKELEEENAELELKIKKLTQHLEPQAMTALFEQVEEEVNQEQKIKELETKVKEWQALQEMFEGKSFKLEGEIANIHKENAELEKEISNLLSCKNCPENKGGYICQKEYEDKCLAQKIQYIKELQEENADIKEKRDYYKDMADTANKVYNENLDYSWYLEGQLTQSKDLLKKLCDETRSYINDQGFDIEILTEAEQFLKENK